METITITSKDHKEHLADLECYHSIVIDHVNKTYAVMRQGRLSLSNNRWHNMIIKHKELTNYSDITVQSYMGRTSAKKLKAQGFKRV